LNISLQKNLRILLNISIWKHFKILSKD
jgi:hypothetical protein